MKYLAALRTLMQLDGGRGNLVIALLVVALSNVVVTLVTLVWLGQVGPNVLAISTLSSLIIVLPATSLVGAWRRRIAESYRHSLQFEIERTRSYLGEAIESARMLYWELDLTSGSFQFDHSKLEWLGMAEPATPMGIRDWMAQMHPEDHAPFTACLEAALLPESTGFDLDYRMRQASGDWGWLHTRAQVKARSPKGQPLLAVGGTISIDQRKRTESALRNSEALLRATLASTDEGILIIGTNGQVLSVNERFLELWRVPTELAATGRDELLLGHVLGQLCDPDSFMDQVRRLYGSDAEARDRLQFKDGRVFDRYTRTLAETGQYGRIWCFRDVTEQARSQSALADSEQKLRAILDNVDACIYLKDAEGRYLFANRATCELWQTSPQAVIGQTDAQFFDRQTAQAIQANDRLVFDTGEKLCTEEQNQLRQTGQNIAYLSTKLPLRKDDGSIYALCGISTNVTTIKDLNRRLEEGNRFQTALMAAIPIPIFYRDRRGRDLGANLAYEQFMGRQRLVPGGESVQACGHDDPSKAERERDMHLMQRGGFEVYESEVEDATGAVHDVVFHKACFLDEAGQVSGLIGAIVDITDRKRSEGAVRESEQRAQSLYTLLRMVADNVPDLIWAKGLNRNFLFANKAMCEQLLMASDTDEPVGKTDRYFYLREQTRHADDPHWFTYGEVSQDSDDLTLQRGLASRFEESGNVQGQLRYFDTRKAPLVSERGEIIGVVGAAREVTAEREIRENLQVSAMVLANSSEALLLCDAGNRIVAVNPAFTHMTGYSFEEVAGKDPKLLASGQQNQDFYRSMWERIHATGKWQGEVWNRRKNGELFAEWLTINTLYLDDGSVHRRVALFSDITEKKRSEELVWTQANFDALTGLPNRRMFLDRLAQELKKAHRGGLKLALMFLDLDHFKEINDVLGHNEGDVLLAEAARRIAACMRESDTVARVGGDEFTVILSDQTDTGGVDRIANDILVALAQPFMLGAQQAFVSVSIGITIYPDDAVTQDELLKNADQAMYVSKGAGRNRFSYFTRAMQDAAQHRLHLMSDLRGALALNQFELHYQPIVDLCSGGIHKAEALLRWTHPTRGPVGPSEFIGLAEESGLIHDIGLWVLAQATRQAQRWRAHCDPSFQVSVNLSPVQLQSGARQLPWRSMLEDARLMGDALVLEITEGVLLDQSPRVVEELRALRAAGVEVAIDDFGTGYSAMSYLRHLDINYLKIDKSFVCNLAVDSSDFAMCEAIVVMAHKLGLKVVAEGVEGADQRDLLRGMGCDFAQGYCFAEALAPDEFERRFLSA